MKGSFPFKAAFLKIRIYASSIVDVLFFSFSKRSYASTSLHTVWEASFYFPEVLL